MSLYSPTAGVRAGHGDQSPLHNLVLVPSMSSSSGHPSLQKHAGRFGDEEAACQVHPHLAHVGVRETMHGHMDWVLSQLLHAAKTCGRCSSGSSGAMPMLLSLLS